MEDLKVSAIGALKAAGFPPEIPEPDTGFRRFRRRDQAHLWVIANSGTGRSGKPWLHVAAGNAKEAGGVGRATFSWDSHRDHPDAILSPEELAEVKAQSEAKTREAEAKRNLERERARMKAARDWDAATPTGADAHPYLIRKGVGAHGVRIAGNRLLIPVRDTAGTLHTLQRIDPDGSRLFDRGGAKTGHFHLIGQPTPGGRLYLAEGYATGATDHEATGAPVAVAFDCGNMEAVARALRAAYPDSVLIVAGDNDLWTKGNPGATHAKAAADATGAALVLPRFRDTTNHPTDFNDLAQAEGVDEVRRQLDAAAPGPVQDPAPTQAPESTTTPSQDPAPTQAPAPTTTPSQDPAPTQAPDQEPKPARKDLRVIQGGKEKASSPDKTSAKANGKGKGGEKSATQTPPNQDPPFFFRDNKTYRRGDNSDGVLLANFAARILEQRIADDGTREEVRFLVGGTSRSGTLKEIEIPASRFSGMSWPVEQWGFGVVILPGNGIKDALRAAIQVLSDGAPTVTVYQHTGWRRIDGAWRYLHAQGALGSDSTDKSLTVEIGDGGPDDRMNLFRLPEAPTGDGRRDLVREALTLLDLSERRELGYLLVSALGRAPLAEALPVDFAIHVAGRTGAKKSEATALLQQFWGYGFNARSFAASFEDTPASLLKKAHRAKDAVLVVDDFRPRGSPRDIERQHAEVDKLIRAAGNQAGRGRQTRDLLSRSNHFPRGLMVTTGEDTFRGHSLRARLLIYEAQPAEVRVNVLTKLQDAGRSGRLAGAMAAYLAWLAPQMDGMGDTIRNEIQSARVNLPPMGHPRGIDIYANLFAGARRFFNFATAAGAINAQEAAAHKLNADAALRQLLRDQADLQDEADEVTIFLDVLRSAVATGNAYLRDAESGREPITNPGAWGYQEDTAGGFARWTHGAECLGFVDREHVFLYPGPAFALAVKQAAAQGHSIGVGQRTLYTRAKERGLLAKTDEGDKTFTARRYCNGIRERFVWVAIEAFRGGTV